MDSCPGFQAPRRRNAMVPVMTLMNIKRKKIRIVIVTPIIMRLKTLLTIRIIMMLSMRTILAVIRIATPMTTMITVATVVG